MRELTQFTFVRFLSVVQLETSDEAQFWQQLPNAGFKPFASGVQQHGILLIYRDILFNHKDIKEGNVEALATKEYHCLQHMFKECNVPAQCLSSMVSQSELFNIPTKDVVNDGRTVCMEVYPELEAYVE